MMLDINLIRNNLSLVKKNLDRRFQSEKKEIADHIFNSDKKYRENLQELEKLRHEKNVISQNINDLRKQNKPFHKELERAQSLPQEISKLEQETNLLKERINQGLYKLPNMLHAKVPLGRDATKNKFVRKWGRPKKSTKLKNHVELAESLNVADFDQGREVSGKGFNYLKGKLAQLDFALQRYGVDFLLKKGFTLVNPPIMLRRDTLLGAVDLEAFENVIYKVENEDLYLIGTAEHSLVSYLKNKTIKKEELPIKICALTPCFRKEIGGHGVDMKGLFRMHQFNKVEQVVFTTQENSYKILEELQKITEEFFKGLKIPYRVIEICSGDLGGKFAKQYDIEAWMPRQGEYAEVTSAGNCTDYQARRLNIKYLENGEKKYCHILNNTMVATSRAMVAILENYQEKNGNVKIPKVLWKYTGFKEIKH
nr:hypothetical protein [uncultured archaeon]AQS28492.1 hypothetical protein [uncultured archaeon]AQS28602.1 hypothetical protein [uncultured archaeon]